MSLLVLAHLGSPGKRAMDVCVFAVIDDGNLFSKANKISVLKTEMLKFTFKMTGN